LEQLLVECFEVMEEQGSAGLEKLCAAHPEHANALRALVERLDTFGLGARTGDDAAPSFPAQLGDFKLLRRLGQGGMGVVYEALQVSLARCVALKLVRPELLYFPGHRERFQREVAAVARMQHPGIVPVYTVGEEQGIPYFAMELVDGCILADVLAWLECDDPAQLTGRDFAASIAACCGPDDAATPTGPAFEGSWIDAALRVVRQVAEALEHAHSRGVVHRDVKPTNIALTRTGRAMLLDFGLSSSDAATRLTRSGSQPGSLPYMSPEQVEGERQVDARTDVYSLGVTLWELLTLQRAFDDTSSAALRRKIVAGELPRPHELNGRVPRDVEIVCQTAMEIDRGRRYATADDLARDLGNVLARRPIEARRTGSWLRALRWAQRHPTTSVASLVALLLAVVGALGFAWQRGEHAVVLAGERDAAQQSEQIAKDERARADQNAALADQRSEEARAAQATAESEAAEAQRQRDGAERVVGFLVDLFDRADPTRNPAEVTAKDLLDRGARRIAGRLEEDRLVRAHLMEAMGRAYCSLGFYGESEPLLLGAPDIRSDELASTDLDVLTNLENVGTLRYAQGRYEEAEELLERAVASLTASRGAKDLYTLHALETLARLRVRQGRFDEAEVAFREILDERAAQLGPDDQRTLHALGNVAAILGRGSRFREGLPYFEELVERFAAKHGDAHEDTIVSLYNLAQLRQQLGELKEAEILVRRAREASEQVFGARHFRTWVTRDLLAVVLMRQGRLAAGEEQFRAVYEERCEELGAEHPDSLRSLNQLATCLSHQGRYGEVEELNRQALVLLRERLGVENPQTQKVLWDLADMLRALERFDEAEPLARELLEATPGDHPELERRTQLLAAILDR